MTDEADHPQTVTVDHGIEFIRTNQGEDRWFVQIECFDPHEPFFSYQKYKDRYPHEYDGRTSTGRTHARVTEDPLTAQHLQMEYAALVSMCDVSLGRVLDLMDELKLTTRC